MINKEMFLFSLYIFFILADLKIFYYIDLFSLSSTPIKSEQLDEFEKQARRVHNKTNAPSGLHTFERCFRHSNMVSMTAATMHVIHPPP